MAKVSTTAVEVDNHDKLSLWFVKPGSSRTQYLGSLEVEYKNGKVVIQNPHNIPVELVQDYNQSFTEEK